MKNDFKIKNSVRGSDPITKSFQIRKASETDAEALVSIYAPYVLETAITYEVEVPTVEEFKQRIKHILEKLPYLVAEHDGKIVGYAYAAPFHVRVAARFNVEASIYIDKDFQHSGLGKRLYIALEDILKKQGYLNINVSIAYPDNEDEHLTKNSAEFHEHLGYRMVGEFHKCGYKFNRWYNLIWMEKFIGEHVENQPEVKRFDEIESEIDFNEY